MKKSIFLILALTLVMAGSLFGGGQQEEAKEAKEITLKWPSIWVFQIDFPFYL